MPLSCFFPHWPTFADISLRVLRPINEYQSSALSTPQTALTSQYFDSHFYTLSPWQCCEEVPAPMTSPVDTVPVVLGLLWSRLGTDRPSGKKSQDPRRKC